MLDGIEKTIFDLIEATSSKNDYISEDDIFDLQTKIVEIIKKNDFPNLKLNPDDSRCNFYLNFAVEDYIGVDKIRRRQSRERSEKMTAIIIKRARRILSRIKNPKED